MNNNERKEKLNELLTYVRSLESDAKTASEKYSSDVHSQNAFQVGYLNSGIRQIVADLESLINNK